MEKITRICHVKFLIKKILNLVLEMDATMMDFEDNSFDIIIDKGTLDALMVRIYFIFYFLFLFSVLKTMKFQGI